MKIFKISIHLIGAFVSIYYGTSLVGHEAISLANWIVFSVISAIDCCIVLVYICRRTDLADNNDNSNVLDFLGEHDEFPENPVPPAVKRKFVGEIEESNRGNHSIETQTGND